MDHPLKTTPEKAEKAHAAHLTIIAIKNDLTRDFLRLGAVMSDVKKLRMFEHLNYNSFNTYVCSPEISLSPSTCYALIDIYQTFCLKYEVPEDRLIPIGRKKLEMILPIVTDENHEELMTKAEALSVTDLTKEIKESKGEPTFEYKYTKTTKLVFQGDTYMEHLLEKRLALAEWLCSKCEKYHWTPNSNAASACPYCHDSAINLNGVITYSLLKEKVKVDDKLSGQG